MTRSMLLATAGAALALPLLSGPVLAQGGVGNAGIGAYQGSTYREEHKGEGGEHTSMGHHAAMQKKAAAHHTGASKMAHVPAGSTSTDQLNDMSLAAAKQGQNFAPPPPAAAGAPAAKKSM